MFFAVNQFISVLVSDPVRRILFAILGGILFALTLPFVGLDIYAWFALVPLLMLIKSADSYLSALLESFVFLFTYNLISFSWLIGLHPLTWHGFSIDESIMITTAAWLIPSVFHALILVPFIFLTKVFYDFRADNRSHELDFIDMCILAFAWVVIQHKLITGLGADFGIFSVPLNQLVYSQYQNKALIQIANVIGAIGLEYFLILVNLFLSNFFNIQMFRSHIPSSGLRSRNLNIRKPFLGIQNSIENLQYAITLGVCLLGIMIYGILEIERNKELVRSNKEKLKSFAIIQADYSTAATRGKNKNTDQLITLQYELSQKIQTPKNILIWSEGAVPILNKDPYIETLFRNLASITDIFVFGTYTEKDEKYYNSIELLEFKFSEATVIPKIHPTKFRADLPSYINFEQGDVLDFAETKSKESTEEEPLIQSGRKLEEILIFEYHKRNLVPFGEYTPLIDYLPRELKQLANSTVGTGFSSATDTQEPIKTFGLNIADAICFELLFSDLVREQIIKDAEVILNLNDLSWFKSFLKGDILKKQFLAVAVFRAVENKKDLLLAGNSGFSALIDATGKIQAISQPNKISILQGYFMPRKEKSLFSLYGW